jgi:hypothetical protein
MACRLFVVVGGQSPKDAFGGAAKTDELENGRGE